jgi:hypothetical protein
MRSVQAALVDAIAGDELWSFVEKNEATPLGNTLQFKVNRNGLTQIMTVKPEQLSAATSN